MCSRPVAAASHDALIQGLQGLILQLQAIADGLSPQDAAHGQLTLALLRADGLLKASLDDIAAQKGRR